MKSISTLVGMIITIVVATVIIVFGLFFIWLSITTKFQAQMVNIQNKASQTVTCTPKWQCGWGSCVNGTQSMTSVDSNHCGLPPSNVNIACPALARICNNK